MRLDVTSLEDAVRQLDRSLGYLASDIAVSDPGLREQFRAAAIQAFEYVYELATKLVRRRLEATALDPTEARKLEFMALMRAAAEAGLVTDATRWHGYRELRNRTSHTYDAGEAETVVEALPDFLDEARTLLERLRGRTDG